MIIEASQINSNGGIVLLDLLLRKIKELELEVVVYISYDSVYQKFEKYQSENIVIYKTSIIHTFLRYAKPRKHVLYFCNLPPFVKNEFSVLYIHNLFFVSKPEWTNCDSSVSLNFRKFLYYPWLKLFSKNVSTIACQTQEMCRLLKTNLSVNPLILPFFESIQVANKNEIKKYDFFYPGSSSIHKNNRRLIDAVEEALKSVDFKIVLTIDGDDELLARIDTINRIHGSQVIFNVGLIPHEKVVDYYSKAKALLFPSLKESFGLPLIEASQSGILIISSDLPFTHDILENPITFDPNDSHSIAKAIIEFMNEKYHDTEQKLKVNSKLDILLDLFK